MNKGTTTVENPLALIPSVREDWENITSVGRDISQNERFGFTQKEG